MISRYYAYLSIPMSYMACGWISQWITSQTRQSLVQPSRQPSPLLAWTAVALPICSRNHPKTTCGWLAMWSPIAVQIVWTVGTSCSCPRGN